MRCSTIDVAEVERRRFGLTETAIIGTLMLLACHAWMYWFLTDDAFISFRYARNLSEGYGLVFNPGQERVEGYSNFLWVLLLALGNSLGLRPEWIANPLSMAATAALWGMTVWFAYRTPPAPGRRWLLIVPALFLAATRSVAVWSTSGLETRMFEALVVAGAFRLILEIEAHSAGRPRRGLAGPLFALATLTRPDGLLISGMALGAGGAYLLARRRPGWGRFVAWNAGMYCLPVGGHFAFRLAYYGYWFPNTYYAKVGGETWWEMGLTYLGAFALEYAVYLWIPLLIAGVWAYCRRGTGYIPLIFGVIVVPHAAYIAAIGGDHFEYRPLDLYFPFAFLLLYEGACFLARGVRATCGVGVYLAVVLIGLTEIGWQSHRQYPSSYIPGFPGQIHWDWQSASDFLAPDRSWVYNRTGLDRIARLHRKLLREATNHYVGNRQEEHRLFCKTVVSRGLQLRELADQGVFPTDAHIVLTAVGAIPYYSDFRVLDYLGLTDAHVAHSTRRKGQRYLAHSRSADDEYIREIGVDFHPLLGVTCLIRIDDPQWVEVLFSSLQRQNGPVVYVGEAGEDHYLFGYLPQGVEHAARRFPAITFRPLTERSVVLSLLRAAMDRYRQMEEDGRADFRIYAAWANVLLNLNRNYEKAAELLRKIVAERPADAGAWASLAIAEIACGNREESRAAALRALALAREQEESDWAGRMRQRIEESWWRLGERISLP